MKIFTARRFKTKTKVKITEDHVRRECEYSADFAAALLQGSAC